MTGTQLNERLLNFGNLDVDPAVVVGWIDQAQKEVCIDLPAKFTITNTVTAGEQVTVANGVFKLLSATLADGTLYPLSDITITGDTKLTFATAGEVTLTYTSITPTYTTIGDELSIHPALHSHVFYYLVSMYYDMDGEGDDEESALADKFYQRWNYYKNITIESIKNSDNETSSMDPVETVDVLPRSRRRIMEEVDEY